ncbi:MAG: helix-turn-helix domain-containing protein [Desulfobulbus sp.]
MSFTNRLKEIREDRGLKQKEMAELMKVSLSSYQRYELGNGVPDGNALKKLAEYGYNIHWLITGQGTKNTFTNFSKNSELSTIKAWLDENEKNEKEIYTWFRVEFEKKFPEYKQWKEEKERTRSEETETQAYKVA